MPVDSTSWHLLMTHRLFTAAEPQPSAKPGNTRKFVFARFPTSMPASQADVGLPPKYSSPVKVIGATCLGKSLPDGRPDYYDADNWILELESTMMCFKGRLSANDPKSWTPRIRLALKIPYESYLMEQQHCLDIDANGKPHEHFRWYMYVSDFVQYFTEIWVYYKSHQFPFKVSYDGFRNQTMLATSKKATTGKEVRANFNQILSILTSVTGFAV